jgi:hypothetical protein
MPKRKASRAITIAGIAAIGAVVVVMVLLFAAERTNSEAQRSIDMIAVDVVALTRDFQTEEGKWVRKQSDNSSMVAVIDQYDPRYQALIDRASALEIPDRYETPRELLIKALESEKQGNLHLKNYILTGSQEEYDKSIDLVSLSLQYSADYDSAMKSAG